MRGELMNAARAVLRWVGGALLVVFVVVWLAAPSAVTIAAGVTVVLFLLVRYCLLTATPHPLLAALIGAPAIGGADGGRFVFGAAQHAALAHATAWTTPTARQFARAFARAASELARGGDMYMRTLALEGATLVPLLRGDVAAIGDTVTLLLSALAPLPVDPGDAAFIPVKAIKLLARCFELVADDRIVPAVRALVDAPSWAVAEEARAMLALVMLHAALRDARDAFAAASLLDESARLAAEAAEGERPDAELLVLVARTLLVEAPAGSWKGHGAWRERARELLLDLMRVFRETRDPPPPEGAVLKALHAALTAH